MNTKDLIEKLSTVGVRCLAMESITSVKTAADNFRQALAVLDSTVAVMESAGRLSDLDNIIARADALKSATVEAETTLHTTEHYLEQIKSEA